MSTARETTTNIRTSHAEKEAWRQLAPGGRVSSWLRGLANREVEKAKK